MLDFPDFFFFLHDFSWSFFFLVGLSGYTVFLLVWVSNQDACLTKTELEMHTKPLARWY